MAMLLLTGCNYVFSPITTTPAALIGIYDKTGKRDAWRRYAERGDVYAQFELAESLASGRLEGHTDGREAFRWYCRAAGSGYARAQVAAGEIYEGRRVLSDLAVRPDPARALMWYALAANRLNEEGRMRAETLRRSLSAPVIAEADMFIQNPGFVPCGL